MLEPRVFGVSELTRYLKELIEGDPTLVGIWVRGEVINFNHHSSGHMYFSLKDESSRLRCVMFRSQNSKLTCAIRDGMTVFAYGTVGVYEKGGEYQLYVEMVEPAGIGAMYLAFLELRDKLAKEGLLDDSRKRPLPAFPRTVGVVTSPTGAAIRDIISIITRRARGIHIVISPALVQGDEAPGSIVSALEHLYSYKDVDVIIVGRGGGAMEELWAFNDERVARAIAASPVPVISAVGHETDFTIADFVADRRAPTPSAAAELAVPDCAQLSSTLASYFARMNVVMANLINSSRRRLKELADSRALRSPQEGLRDKRQQIDDAAREIQDDILRILERAKDRVAAIAGRLEALSPLATLKRGYSICRLLPERRVVKSIFQVDVGDHVEVIVNDGAIECDIRKLVEARIYDEDSAESQE
ncbi:MAG TPA: exodeoxyribonuclease VII large subunit [Firmicutes bacterium]|nr:exodeoxyribonuclease VII large subunit [Bacillota bacterium]HHY97302.1 exodeoxyribonuclease VII large subunit [Bacillota bacterium]